MKNHNSMSYKANSRFIVRIFDVNDNYIIPSWVIFSISRPQLDNNLITLRCYEPTVGNIYFSLYNNRSNLTIEVIELDEFGGSIEEWKLLKCNIKELIGPDFNWNSAISNFSNIRIVMNYEKLWVKGMDICQ